MSSLRIDSYNQNYLDGITALFNSETAFSPHVAPLTPERFVELVEQKSYFAPDGLLVALNNDKVVGWIHACVAPGSERSHNQANPVPRIRILIFSRSDLRTGYLLVKEATAWLKQSGQTLFEAMHAQIGYPFYRGLWFGGEPMGPLTLPHVQMAFEVGGYKTTQQSIFIARALDTPPQKISASVTLEFSEKPAEFAHEGMRESWIGFEPMQTRAYINGEEVGRIGWVLQPYLDRLGAPCMNIWGLSVQEAHRRKGIASALIAQALVSAYARGARFASVGTQLWNAPAHATYAAMGFEPNTVLAGRILNLAEPDKEGK